MKNCLSVFIHSPKLYFAVFLIAVIAIAFAVPIAHASTITVNSISDATSNADNLCTLREAIIAANTNLPPVWVLENLPPAVLGWTPSSLL